MVNTWFVMIPPGYANKSDAQKELVDFRIQYQAGSSAWNDAKAGHVIQGAEGNTGNPQVSEPLVRWKGPYATEAEAKTAQAPKQQSPNPVNDAVNAVQNSNLLSIPAAIGDFFAALGQAHTWIRVAKVVVGGVLLIVGLVHITGADNALASAARKVPLPV